MYASLRRTNGEAGFCEAKVLKKEYESPVLTITELKNDDVITTSGLIFGGDNGKSDKESFNDLFGKN